MGELPQRNDALRPLAHRQTLTASLRCPTVPTFVLAGSFLPVICLRAVRLSLHLRTRRVYRCRLSNR